MQKPHTGLFSPFISLTLLQTDCFVEFNFAGQKQFSTIVISNDKNPRVYPSFFSPNPKTSHLVEKQGEIRVPHRHRQHKIFLFDHSSLPIIFFFKITSLAHQEQARQEALYLITLPL